MCSTGWSPAPCRPQPCYQRCLGSSGSWAVLSGAAKPVVASTGARWAASRAAGSGLETAGLNATELSAYCRERNKAKELLQYFRERWSIENSWHWVRDTQLRKDAHRYRECNGVQVLAALLTMALNLLRLNEFHSIADGLGTVCQSVALLLRLMRCHVQESPQTVSARDF